MAKVNMLQDRFSALEYRQGGEYNLSTPSQRHIRYAVLAVSAVMYLLTVVLVLWRLAVPSDAARMGFQTPSTSDAVTVTPLVEQPGGLQPGDLVVAVAGKPIPYWADAIFNFSPTQPGWNFHQTVLYSVIRFGQVVEVPVTLERYPLASIVRDNWLTIAFLIGLQIGAVGLFSRRPDEQPAQILFLAACAMVTFCVSYFIGADLAAFVNAKALWLYYRLVTILVFIQMISALLHFALLLPRLYARHVLDRRLTGLIYGTPYLFYAVYLLVTNLASGSTLKWLRVWENAGWLLFFIYVIGSLVGVVSSYRSLQVPLDRKRVEAVTLAYILSAFLALVLGWIPIWVTGSSWVSWNALPLLSLPVVLGLGIAVAFFRLFDLKIVIQRTLIWSALTAIILAIYIGVVGILSIIFQLPNNPVFSLIATGVAAVVFQPIRERLQRNLTLLIFGERDTPYEVVARLTNKLEAVLAPQVALDTIVQTVSEALRLSYTAVELRQDKDYIIAADWGTSERVPHSEWVAFPIHHGSDVIGRLVVAPRVAGDRLTPGDYRLISGLVHHAREIIQIARLTADLQRSREKLVMAREEERRRLRRELHDGLGPALASLTLQIDATRNLLNTDAAQADTLLLNLKSQVQSAVTDVRRLAYELRPPALDDLGLIAALHERAHQFEQSGEMVVTVESPPLPPLPAATELAMYRIALEALTNAARHAHATHCSIRLTLDHDRLYLEVRDNGQGLPTKPRHGIGIQSMRERVAELGGFCTIENNLEGGTSVGATLPIKSFSPANTEPKGK